MCVVCVCVCVWGGGGERRFSCIYVGWEHFFFFFGGGGGGQNLDFNIFGGFRNIIILGV